MHAGGHVVVSFMNVAYHKYVHTIHSLSLSGH